MYAIVKTGGKQYRVEQGQTLLIERLPEAEGASVALETLLVRGDEAIFDAASLAKVEVTATIIGHVRGPKLRVFKFKPKRGYKRRTGHRQDLTRIEVTKIGPRAERGLHGESPRYRRRRRRPSLRFSRGRTAPEHRDRSQGPLREPTARDQTYSASASTFTTRPRRPIVNCTVPAARA